jgi:hypothetical protein
VWTLNALPHLPAGPGHERARGAQPLWLGHWLRLPEMSESLFTTFRSPIRIRALPQSPGSSSAAAALVLAGAFWTPVACPWAWAWAGMWVRTRDRDRVRGRARGTPKPCRPLPPRSFRAAFNKDNVTLWRILRMMIQYLARSLIVKISSSGNIKYYECWLVLFFGVFILFSFSFDCEWRIL